MLFYKTIAPATLELLTGLQEIQGLKTTRLVGGTSLALQMGHRISVDLDLFAHDLQEDFLSVIAAITKKGYTIEIRKQSSNMLVCMINGVKVDIVNYPYHWLEKEIRQNNIILAAEKDIAAMKLSAITNRGTKKDFIDLFYLLRKFTLKQMLDFYTDKYPGASAFMVIKSLTWFEDADLEIPPVLFDQTIRWEEMKNTIEKEVKRIL